MRCAILKSVLIVACAVNFVQAQANKDQWRRVYTAQDFVTDIGVTSLELQPSYIVRARFRTILSQAESLREQPDKKYKTRVETIDFRLTANEYRVYELILLDGSGKAVWSYAPGSSENWRPYKPDGMMRRLLESALHLQPFGEWKVVNYRFVEGPSGSEQELQRLVGTRVRVGVNRVEVGAKICSQPAFESKRVNDAEFGKQFGVSLRAVGVQESEVQTVAIKCKSEEWTPPRSLLVKVETGQMLMLWDGVFLVLKRD
jgi:hypothetical protein